MNHVNVSGETAGQELTDEVLHRVLGGAGVKKQRQDQQTAFQNFDQKKGQLYQMLSNVLQSLAEARGSSVRNML